MLPISVLVPTRNPGRLLPQHLAAMAQWLDMVQEVVVVDSYSQDGTLDTIKAELRHPRLKILSHPPGLYESWNHGIRQLTGKYCYISTVGDTISREGLEHLCATAERLTCDVVMSKPEFCTMDGRRAAPPFWPVDDMIHSLRITAPKKLSRFEFLTFATVHAGHGLLGSSSSNLSRTAVMAAHPFPVDFGRAGDGIWALRNSCRLSWGVTPKVCSTFLLHPVTASHEEKITWAAAPRSDLVLRETIDSELQSGRLNRATLDEVRIPSLMEEVSNWLDYKERFDRARKSRFYWILNPCAWQKRIMRNRHVRAIARSKIMTLIEIQKRGMTSDHADNLPPEVMEAFMAESGQTLKRCGYA